MLSLCYTCITYYLKFITMLAIRLPENLESRLNALAKATGRTKSFYARTALEEHLDDLEDIYLAEKSLEEIRAGRSAVFTLDDIEKDLDLAD